MEPERARQNESFFKKINTVSITFCLGIIGFHNFRFSIAFILWLALFANQHTKSIEKHKLLEVLIEPRCIMCVQYIGGGGVQYIGGYHEYIGGCLGHRRDTRMPVGDIMSTLGL